MERGCFTAAALALAWVVAGCAGPGQATTQTPQTPLQPPAAAPTPARTAPVAEAPAAAPAPRATIGTINLEELFPLVESGELLLYDARPAVFFRLGHIPGALSLPKNRLTTALAAEQGRLVAARAARRPVVVYCTDRACPDGKVVADRMADLGVPVRIYAGGWEEWKQSGLGG